MSQGQIVFSVFTKAWKQPTAELGAAIRELGFDGIELPVRPGYQVEPESVGKDLPRVARQLGEFGLTITSIAGPTDEPTFAACAEAGVRTIRICVGVWPELGYLASEDKHRRQFDQWMPLLEKYDITLGIQNHCDCCICHAMGIMRLIEGYDPRRIAAIWDPGHCALNGEDPELAADIIWSRLCRVNLKNAVWRQTNSPQEPVAQWRSYWTTGRLGLSPWPRVVAELQRRNYRGEICLSAEYDDEKATPRLIADDLTFAQSLFNFRETEHGQKNLPAPAQA